MRKQNKEKIKTRSDRIRSNNREYVNSRKTPCLKCGEDRKYVIHYHHIDHSTKEFTLGQKMTHSKEHIDKEINKCVCLCANCHTEFHHLYGQNPKDAKKCLEEYLSNA